MNILDFHYTSPELRQMTVIAVLSFTLIGLFLLRSWLKWRREEEAAIKKAEETWL